MKLSHFASAAASVLVLGIAAPAFAQTGYVYGVYGENRDHPHIINTEEVGFTGGFSVPVGMFEVSGEASYLDTGRDSLSTADFGKVETRNQATSFDVQTFFAGSLYTRNDKWGWGATVAGGELGDIIFDEFDNSVNAKLPHNGKATNPNQARFALDKITEVEGSLFAQAYGDKWVGSARVGYGVVSLGTRIIPNPATTGASDRLLNVDSELNYVDVTLDGNFFFTDHAQLTIGVDWKDYELYDPVVSSSIGLEYQLKDSPISLKSNIEFSKWGNSVTIGAVATFGADSINDRVRKGPANPWVSTLRHYSSQFVTGGF